MQLLRNCNNWFISLFTLDTNIFFILNSLILLLLPGPNSYALQALLSFDPPEKYDLAKGTFDELMPERM